MLLLLALTAWGLLYEELRDAQRDFSFINSLSVSAVFLGKSLQSSAVLIVGL